jgi:hypothetical protein
VPLAESSIDMIMAPAYGSAKKNATRHSPRDRRTELGVVSARDRNLHSLSGDSDFSSLVIKLKEYGKYVIGVGIRESSSDLLVMNCDEYYSYNSLAGLVKSGDEEVVKHDPWELVSEAVQRMKRNGDVMRADRLKQVMQQMDSSFDEKNVGKSKFSLFVAKLQRRTAVSQQIGERPVRGRSSASRIRTVAQVAAPAPVAAEPSENGEPRRPRRDSRGRGRDRGRGGRAEKPADATSTAAKVAPAAAAPSPQPQAAPPSAPRTGAASEIGSSGLRLTRAEAFDLVRRAVGSLVTGDSAAAASLVRSTARALLGRDSESLSERNFTRILQDAHDADVVDLRRRGADYEVAASTGGPRWRHSSPLLKSQMRRRPRSQPRLRQEEWLHAAVAARWAEQVHHPHTFSMLA